MNIIKKVFTKNVKAAIVSYIFISLLAAVALVMQIQTDGNVYGEAFRYQPKTEITSWVLIELFAIPLLFLGAGYFITKMWKLEKMIFVKVLLAATGYALIGFVLCKFVYELFLVLNLPVVSGDCALDRFLRETNMSDGSLMYENNYYPDWVLPIVHFVFQILYWLIFYVGNRWSVARRYWKDNK